MWKVLEDYIEYLGFSDFSQGSKGVLKFTFKNNIINNEQVYSDMLIDRNSTTRLYDEKLAQNIFKIIKDKYVKTIKNLINNLEKEQYLS